MATPLIKKLGIKEGFSVRLINPPDNYENLIGGWPEGTRISQDRSDPKDLIHVFSDTTASLKAILPELKNEIRPNGMIWVSWPKRASKVPTDLTEDVIRSMALEIGLVDVKVCAVDAIWSGLKLVIRVKDRK